MRSEFIGIRVDEETYEAIAKHAFECKVTVSDLVRYAVLKEIRMSGGESGE